MTTTGIDRKPAPVAHAGGPTAPSVWPTALRSVLRVALGTVLIVVPVFLFSTLITFVLGATSGLNPAAGIAGDGATPEAVARIDAEFGLDKPVWQQYVDWMSSMFTGDLGVSWFSRIPVGELIGERLAVSASIAGLALVIGLVFGIGLGLLAAVYRESLFDRLVTAYTSVVSTLPPFVISIGLILVFSVWLGWLPSAGYVPLEEDPGRWLMLIIMPAVALSMDVVADIARQLRTGLVAELEQDYVIGAVVRGISPTRVLFVHALRNGSGPALAILGMKIPTLIGGAVVMETMFSMPGFGRLAADSALRGDVPIVQGTLVVAIVFVLVCNVVVNITQGTLQPAAIRRE
ncbi:ABC transporter permease [Rhodococcus sp. 06-156-3C]|uniref:ABC transporter permease n=1 Tax=Nocardiaceae TaxID=85025 RepID=UPI000522FE2A|nr:MULTISPECIES: ABC transporter permease [Rhodococcus]OZD11078.1 ABC transporter permease [Rhodococcus sp. 06-156-4C]OZD14494.1 ABC transporter permease [Rhodococcus sp. 06-156-4a]OZD24828.1 ABC transporter permease [Rhodococcus sp. 06-156-3C]OZD27802.1 ABC transporter permease [Rhodococcus sp. 06-156-3b]OZD39783.1 ABC transporter permease [Rhodococcus sp. 06-156-3]